MAGKLKFSLQEFQEAAVKYRSQFLMMPIIGIQDSLKFMTARPGIRYKERVGSLTGDAQFAPYNPKRAVDFDLKADFRDLETFFGSVVANFEPNSAISTILGLGATKGDGQKSTPTARQVLALIAMSLSEHLNEALWTGVRNPDGNTTADLFDGLDTIVRKEIAAGNIAEANGNYMKFDEPVTSANAVDIAKSILFSLDPRLRKQDCYLYCSQEFLDLYCEGYLLTHGATPYNTKYEQVAVEGSGGKLKFCPMFNKAGSSFMQVSPKSNVLVGFDQMGDVESVDVKEFAPFVLSYIATMFFGTQWQSIDYRFFKAIEIPTIGGSGSSASSSQNIILWEDADAPSIADYPDGGIFMMASTNTNVSPDAKKGTVWRMYIENGKAKFVKYA